MAGGMWTLAVRVHSPGRGYPPAQEGLLAGIQKGKREEMPLISQKGPGLPSSQR